MNFKHSLIMRLIDEIDGILEANGFNSGLPENEDLYEIQMDLIAQSVMLELR